MRRFAVVVMPFLAGVTVCIGLYFVYVGARTVMAGRYVAIGLGFAAFGGVGLILAYALWNVRRQILTRVREEAAAEGRKGTALFVGHTDGADEQ